MLRPPSSGSRGMDDMVIALRTNRRVLLGQARGVGLARKKRRSGSRARGNAKKRNLNGEALWLVKGGKGSGHASPVIFQPCADFHEYTTSIHMAIKDQAVCCRWFGGIPVTTGWKI